MSTSTLVSSQNVVYSQKPIFQKHKSDSPKSFCDQPSKLFRSIVIVVQGALAYITHIVLKVFALFAWIFGFRTLHHYLEAAHWKCKYLANRAYTCIFHFHEVVNFSANRPPFQRKLCHSGNNADNVFKEVYQKDFHEIEQRALRINDSLAEDQTETICSYSFSQRLSAYDHAGYCMGAILDFASRYLKEIKQGSEETEAIKKISKLFQDHVTEKAVILQNIKFSYHYSGVNISEKIALEKDESNFMNMKREVYDAVMGNIDTKEFEKKAEKLSEKAMRSSLALVKDQHLKPVAKLVDLKVVEKSEFLALNKISVTGSRKESANRAQKCFEKTLRKLEKGAYELAYDSYIPSQDNHSTLLIKKKSGDFCFFDPNYGAINFKSKDAAKKLIKHFGSYKTILTPSKFRYLALSKLELSESFSS